jgi:hypothetical protein
MQGLAAHVEQMREGFGPPSTRKSFGLAGFQRLRRSLPTLDSAAIAVLRDQVHGRGGGPALRVAQAVFLEAIGLERAALVTRAAAAAWSAFAAEPTEAAVKAVEAAEREALTAVETALAGVAPGRPTRR